MKARVSIMLMAAVIAAGCSSIAQPDVSVDASGTDSPSIDAMDAGLEDSPCTEMLCGEGTVCCPLQRVCPCGARGVYCSAPFACPPADWCHWDWDL